MSKRNLKVLGQWGPRGSRVIASESMWREPLKWDAAAKAAGERHRVFCASLADVFEGADTMPDEAFFSVEAARLRLFELIMDTPHLDWLLLTKRPENIARMVERAADSATLSSPARARAWLTSWLIGVSPENVWLGTSVENQEQADKRIPHLLKVPAVVRFLSCEPLLGPVDFEELDCWPCYDWRPTWDYWQTWQRMRGIEPEGKPIRLRDGINWIIVGGESGHGARPMDIQWSRSIRDQCKAAGVACFIKQLGALITVKNDSGMEWPHHGDEWIVDADYRPRYQGEPIEIKLGDSKGGNPEEWPADLRVREFPKVEA